MKTHFTVHHFNNVLTVTFLIDSVGALVEMETHFYNNNNNTNTTTIIDHSEKIRLMGVQCALRIIVS